MNLIAQIFYIIPLFFILYLLYELVDYKRTKNFLNLIVDSVKNETPLPKELGLQFLMEFISFMWVCVSLFHSAFSGMWMVFLLGIVVILMEIVQMFITIYLTNRNKSIVLSYYITTMITILSFAYIIILTGAIDLLSII